MKFHLTRAEGRNLFTGYGDGYVAVNDHQYQHHIVVTPEHVAKWDAVSFESLTAAHFEALLESKPEIVLFGTGGALRFPHPRITSAIAAAGIGFEVMDTKAACRTYNVLMSEGRKVLAAVFV